MRLLQLAPMESLTSKAPKSNSMAFTEDMSDFINPDTPGYVVATVGGQDLEALKDAAYSETDIGGAGFSARDRMLHAADARLSALSVSHGTSIVVDGVTYKVAEIEPDGTGLTTLVLKK